MASPKTLATRLPNVKQENLLYCEEILAHPNTNVQKNEGKCQNALSYVAFPGSPSWTFRDNGYDVSIPYNATIW